MVAPLHAFLSYRRLDAAEAGELERALALRGVSLWRDVNDLPLGGLTEREIRRGIERSDAFILYVTPRVFSSDVIWRVEVPAALARTRPEELRGRRYPIIPVFRGVTVREFRQRSAAAGLAELPLRNGAFVPRHRSDRATARARRLAYAAIASRLLRALLAHRGKAITSLTLRSFTVPEPSSDLDLDWSDVLDTAGPRVWEAELVPAMHDLRAELARAHRRRLSFLVRARLGAALLAGMVFPLATGFDVLVHDRHGVWPARGSGQPLQREDEGNVGSSRAVLEVSLAQDAGDGARALASRIRARHIRLTPPGGPRRAYDPRSRAGAIARQIGDIARELRAGGTRDLHFVFSGPAALAFLVGRHLHAVGLMHCYYRGSHGGLVRAYRLPT